MAQLHLKTFLERYRLSSVPDLYEVLLDDESSKVPLHRVLLNTPQEQVKPLIRSLSGGRALVRTVIAKNPMCWDDVFQIPANRPSRNGTTPEITKSLTLWTDGKINIRSCSAESLDALWQWQFSSTAPDFLMSLMRQSGVDNVNFELRNLGLSQAQQTFVNEWLSTTSNTFSVRIAVSRNAVSRNTDHYTRHYTFVKRGTIGFADEHFGFHDP